jgi:L-lactate dehydrogenase complex protein LldF
MPAVPTDRFHTTLADANLQLAIYTSTGRLMDHRKHAIGADTLPDYQELRTHAHNLKKHTIDNLDYYLEEFESRVAEHGGTVVFCSDGTEVADFILNLAKQRGAHLIVKSKSMTTEEIDLNERLDHHGLHAVETDLGEYIIQLAGEKPYHIVAPALHKTRYDVAEIFTRELGIEEETVPEKQTMIARAVLREKFLAADHECAKNSYRRSRY